MLTDQQKSLLKIIELRKSIESIKNEVDALELAEMLEEQAKKIKQEYAEKHPEETNNEEL